MKLRGASVGRIKRVRVSSIPGIHLGDSAFWIQTSVINEYCNQAGCGLIAGGKS